MTSEPPFRILPRLDRPQPRLLDRRRARASCASGAARTAATTSTRRSRSARSCHSKNLAVEAVSGRATLATYSINHQTWMPGPELPYVVAIVEIVEQPSVRLTTNLVNCPHDEIEIGMPVRVTFEHHADPDGDVYLPLFEPERMSRWTRTRSSSGARASRGVGQSEIGRRLVPRPARAHARRLPRRDRRRRAHDRRHRRAVDVSRARWARPPASAARARTR